ncbi:MAG: serine/threonine-protein kinase [Polyangia bacterium]
MPPPVFEPRRFGAYALEARLGHGGMAEVFRASREGVAGFARQCVVKRILGHHNEDPSFVDMFINEAKIASELTHPNIVQVYELGQVDGEFFIAMEFVKGRDLLRVLRELAQKRPADPAIPPAIAAYVARETCRALQHAHDHTDSRGAARPIIHRDVSPQNIMLSYDGIIKLVDFGIAKALGSMRDETRTGALKGKFAYMAPEQIAGQNPGPSADVFAAGVVLHEMLTGRRLFKGATDYDTLQKVRNMPVTIPSSIDPRIPRELDDIVMKSLERDRSRRYERASHMARDLDGFLSTARFSVEEMSDFMCDLFPPALREPTLPENVTKEYLVKSSSSSKSAVSLSGLVMEDATPITGSSILAPPTDAHQRLDTPTGTSGGRRTLFLAGGLALMVGMGGIFLVSRKTIPDVTAPEPTAAHGLGRSDVVTPLPPETRTVRLVTDPGDARVFDGPRLVGTTPLALRLAVDSPGLTLTLVHDGRADLTYVVRPSDAPELTLRLVEVPMDPLPTATPSVQHSSHTSSHGPHKHSDSDEPGSIESRPKVEPLDD